MSDADVLRLVIESVGDVVAPVWVADRLPPNRELDKNLPCVVIDLLPGSEVMPWGGTPDSPIQQTVALDVMVYGRSRGEATPLGDRVRAALHQLPFQEGNGVVGVDCPRLSTREDMNPNVKAIGVVADVLLGAQ